MDKRLPLTDAAFRLGLTYHQCRAKLLRGELPGGRDAFGRLYVDAKAVEPPRAPREAGRRGTPDLPRKAP